MGVDISNPFVGPMVLRKQWRPKPSQRGPLRASYLDYLAPTSCYGVRRIIGNYSGACVRRQTTGVNYAFLGNDFDLTTYVADVGAGDGTLDRWYDQSNNGRHLTIGSETGWIRNSSTTYTVGGKPAIRSTGQAFVAPSNLTNYITASAATILWAGQIDSVSANNADPSTNNAAWRDNFGIVGLSFTSTGSAQAWNDDNTTWDIAAQPYTLSTAVFVAWRHRSGNIEINVNGRGWTTVASADTRAITGTMAIGFNGTMRHLEFATFNIALSDADVTAWGSDAATYYGGTWGSTMTDPWAIDRSPARLPWDGPADRLRMLRD